MNTYADVGGTFVAGHLERTTHTAGVLTNTALEDTREEISVEISAKNAISAARRGVRVAILVDTGSGYVVQGSAPFTVDVNVEPLRLSRVLANRLKTGDKIKVQIKNTTNSDNILVTDIDVKRRRIC